MCIEKRKMNCKLDTFGDIPILVLEAIQPVDLNTIIVQTDGDIRTTHYYSAKIDDIDEMLQQYRTSLDRRKLDRMDLFLDHLKNNERSNLHAYSIGE